MLRNFKSFKHADIEMDKAFNIIVGPNGSGKSNIIDSLLFAFGESHLKSMRVKKTSDLIYGDHKVAEVTVELADISGKAHSVQRMVRRDGKTKYSLDGKRAKKYAIEDFLSAHRVSLANIIKQGEVQRIVEMNSKDRRALIDEVANVADYERKKTEALGELDKVDEKLNEATAILGEREGYLEALEKEKAEAEKYVSLKAEHDSLKATVLSIDASQLEGEFVELVKSLGESGSRMSQIDAQIRELEGKITGVEAEKAVLNKEIMDRGEGKELELQREIDALSSNIIFAEKTAEEKKAASKKDADKLAQLANERRRADDEVRGANARIKENEAELAEIEKQLKAATADLDEMTKASSEFSSQYHEAKKTLQRCEDEMAACKDQLGELMVKVGTFAEVIKLKEGALENLRRGVFDSGAEQKKKELAAKKKEQAGVLAEINGEFSKLFEREKQLNQRMPAVYDVLMAAKEKKAEFAVKLRHVHENREKPIEALKDMKGVHGTLEQLCTYETENAVPVQVAIGPRMDFLVVDSARTASECIERVKQMKLGRVSFIPLDRINAPQLGAEAKRLAGSKGSLGFIIDFIRFDPRFDRAFRYACGDTLLMDSLKSMEPLVGKIRMVSMGGELADASGLMTGGRVSERVTAARDRALYDEWEAKVQAAATEQRAILDELNLLRDQLGDARKKKATAEVALKAAEIEEDHLRAEEEKALSAKKDTAAAMRAFEAEITAARKQSDDVDEKRAQLVRKLSDLNIEKLDAGQKIDVEKEQNFGITIKEREKRISELRINKADYSSRIHSHKTSAAVYEKAAAGLVAEEKELEAAVDGADAVVKKAHADIKEWKAVREQKNAEQKAVSNAFKELIEKREELEAAIKKVGNEVGHLKLDRDKTEGASHKNEIRKATLEAQLASAKAELAAFENVPIIQNKTEKDKPHLIARASEAETKMKEIGNVNMLAITLYAKKSEELTEQKRKVQQLVDEKQAVISIINEIELKKIATFMAAFNVVDENFRKLFANVFTGKGRLILENPPSPFEGGLTIEVQLDNKEIKYLEIMSGGEKSLIALMFLFAIQAQNPSSIYVLDEADAALDQENSRKLALLLKQLSKDSQFMAVSHNETLFKNANCLVGISMTKEGSKPVEVELTDMAKA